MLRKGMVIMMKGFLQYSPGDSVLHTLNPLTKLALAFLICVGCFVSDNHFFVLGLIALSVALAFVGGIGLRALRMLRTLSILGLVLFCLQVLFTRSGTTLFTLPFGLNVTDRGVSFAALLALRLIGATLPLAVMLSLTKLNDLSGALVEKLHIPYKYAFALTTALRFIPVFTGEMAAIMEAQTARGVEFDTKNPVKKIRLVLPLCLPLLLSSVGKTEDGAVSAELRGFNLRRRSSAYKTYPVRGGDVACLLASVAVVALAVVV